MQNSQRKAVVWLANKLRAYAERGEFGDDYWFAKFGQSGPTTEAHRGKIFYGALLIENYIGELVANPAIEGAIMGICRGNREDHLSVFEAMLAAGVSRRDAHWVKWPRSSPQPSLFDNLDTLVNRLADPPCEEDGRTVFDALIDALRAVAPSPAKPTANDNRRFKAFELGVGRQKIAEKEGVSERAIDASISKVRAWRDYQGIDSTPKRLCGKKRALNASNEPQTPPARITRSATTKN